MCKDTGLMKSAYITSIGAFLPGEAVNNEEVEEILGLLGTRGSKIKDRILRDNGIRSRHYSLDREKKSRFSNAEMAARAIQATLETSDTEAKEINYLATATSQSDLPLPGFASQVHALTSIPSPEIASFQSICSSSLMALKAAYLQIKSGECTRALACASEMPSRLFKASRYASQDSFQESGKVSYDTEFLRWMLSDGAGACLLSDTPKKSGLSLRIDWIRMKSFANKYPLCMYVGPEKDSEGRVTESWLDLPDYQEAARRGFINLRQDVRLLPEVIKLGVEFLFELVEEGTVKINEIDWLLPHYSSEVFRKPIEDLLERGGALIPKEKWFTNLHTKGNTGSASIMIMMEEIFNSDRLKAGDRILCMVPESGQFNLGYMALTVVDGEKSEHSTGSSKASGESEVANLEAPKLELGPGAPQQRLVRELTRVWIDFERELHTIPILKRLVHGGFTIEDYRKLLKNLRAQVVDGSRWITRAASSITDPRLLEIRSVFIHHAKDEHRDYMMLEKNYVSTGGSLETIQNAEKNIGSEALSAWMLQRASRENPVDLLGAMFIIEGLGNKVARMWGERVRDQLSLRDDQVTFFLYHGDNDDNHFDRLEEALNSELLSEAAVDEIVKTAQVTARLYRLQLEELI